MKLRIKSTALTLKIISWIQIIGGIVGFGLMASLILKTGTINGALLLIFIVGIGLFWYSIYSGKRLLTDEKKCTAIILSIINQAIQIFQWSMFSYGFSYCSGAELTLGVQGESLELTFAASVSTFNMAINSDNETFLKINFIAILLIFTLFGILNELRKKRKEIINVQENEIEE